MAELDLNVRVDVAGKRDLDGLSRSFQETDKAASGLSTRTLAVGSAIGAFAGGAALSLAKAGLDTAIESVGHAIELSSDKAEAASKVNVLYGDSAKVIEAEAARAADTVALSSGAYLDAAGMLGNLTRGMGVGKAAAADMSVDMIQLAADMGSFSNADPSEVIAAMGSALTGETEPLKRFGVLLNEATVQQKALELGLYNGKGALDSSARAQAVYALLLDQTKSAQGDLARTSDGLANSQRLAAARQEEAWTRLGDKLYPIAQKVMPLVADAITAVVDVLGNVIGAVSKWVDENQPLIQTVMRVAGVIGDVLGKALGLAFEWLGKVIGIVGALLDAFGKAFGVITSIGGRIFDALIGSVRSVLDWFGNLWSTIRSTADKVMGVLGDLFRPLGDSINGAIRVVKDAWNAFAGFWNSIGIDIPRIEIPNPFGGSVVLGGGRFELPRLPVLDSGGIVTGPTLAMLSANSRPEAIVPLDRMPSGVTVNVYAGVGDPVAIGREVVQAVRAYERANGPAWAAA